MSAYIVSNETINCIVNGLIDNNVIGMLSAQKVGQDILDLNCASVAYRYNEEAEEIAFKFERKGNVVIVNSGYSDVEVWGCIRCWKYQSCEHPRATEMQAWQYVEDLERKLMDKAYPDAPWGLED